jgi:hypothetical protein
MNDACDDLDEIVDRIQKKTGQPREQVEERVKQAARNSRTAHRTRGGKEERWQLREDGAAAASAESASAASS